MKINFFTFTSSLSLLSEKLRQKENYFIFEFIVIQSTTFKIQSLSLKLTENSCKNMASEIIWNNGHNFISLNNEIIHVVIYLSSFTNDT